MTERRVLSNCENSVLSCHSLCRSIERGGCPLHALFERLICVNYHLREGNLLKLGFHPLIQVEIAILGEVVAIVIEPLARGVLVAGAFENAPWLPHGLGVAGGAIELIAAREGAAIEKDSAGW